MLFFRKKSLKWVIIFYEPAKCKINEISIFYHLFCMAYFAKIFKISLGRRYSILKEADLELNITASVIPWVIEILFSYEVTFLTVALSKSG